MALNSFNDLFTGSLYYGLQKFCDAIIVAEDGTEFKAHKLFLSVRSEYFRTYFRGNIEKKDRLVLAFNKDILNDILIFIYTGEVRLRANNIASMIIAADYLLIEDFLVQCKHFAVQEISIENCTSLLIASLTVEKLGITEYCYRFVQVYFESLVDYSKSSIEELPYSILKSLLSHDSLGVIDETTVWKAIVIWVKGNDAERLKYVPELLNCIRWNSVNCSLASAIRKNTVFQENIFCKSIDLEKYTSTSKHEIPQCGTHSFSAERCPSKMYLFMSKNTSPFSNNTYEMYLTYDEQIDIWRKVGEIDESFYNLFGSNRFIFMFNTISREMKAFDLLSKIWVKKENMRSSRQAYWVAQNRNHIFVIGGWSSMTINTDVECYDPKEDVWKFCRPVPSINICGVVVLNEILYVAGYQDEPDRLEMRVLAYDMLYDDWFDIKKPKQIRTSFGLINYREQLYIFGGRTEENNVTTSVEIYSIELKEWVEFPDLPFPYEIPHALILQDKLIVFDDCPVGGTSEYRFSPCIWNDQLQSWIVETIFSPFFEIHRYVFCCIEDREILLELSKENKDSKTVWIKTPFAIL